MKYLRFVRKNLTPIQLFLSLCLAVLVGIYINLLTAFPRQGNLIKTIPSMGWSNLWGTSALVCFYLQVKVSFLEKREKKNRDKILHGLLEVTARSLAYHENIDKTDLRIFCHVADKKTKKLVPIDEWSLHFDDDRTSLIPYEGKEAKGFVIVESYNEKQIIARNLPENHTVIYPGEFTLKIKPNLKSVIAAPICSVEDCQESPLGTISIDSTKTIEENLFNTPEAKDMIEAIAQCAYELLK